MSEPHLKARQYYIDLYDRGTVERCRRTEQSFNKKATSDDPSNRPKGLNKEQAKRAMEAAKEWYLKMETGERYLNKEKTIREWMDRDRQLDELLESAEAPEGIRCLSCRNLLKSTFKTLWHSSDADSPSRVLFMYDCPNGCLPRRAFFSDGEEWRTKPDLCPQCRGPLEKEMRDDEKRMITTRTCPKCGYSDTDEHEWTYKKDEGVDPDFAADRDRFCLTEEEGHKYYEMKSGMEGLARFMEEFKEKEKAREEKLKAHPKGFHLEGVGYRCAICGESTSEGDNWYDKYGVKCLVCQKAIDEGEIPAKLAKHKDDWYSRFELDNFFNLKGQTLRSWVKKGVIKPRIVSHYGKGTHTELFLIEDNMDFLPPKKLLKGRSVRYVEDGKEFTTSQKWYEFQDPFKILKGYKILEYMRVVSPEEMKTRQEERLRKWEERRAMREAQKAKRKTKGSTRSSSRKASRGGSTK